MITELPAGLWVELLSEACGLSVNSSGPSANIGGRKSRDMCVCRL